MPELGDKVRTVEEVLSEFRNLRIPAGSEGHIVEIYKEPEGYAVDLAISRPDLVGERTWENVVLTPNQFVVTAGDRQPGSDGE